MFINDFVNDRGCKRHTHLLYYIVLHSTERSGKMARDTWYDMFTCKMYGKLSITTTSFHISMFQNARLGSRAKGASGAP